MKRKVLCSIIAAMCFAYPVMAAETDLSSMTLDELVELRNSITQEILARTADEEMETIPAGVYVAGTDIKVGSYTITVSEDGNVAMFIYENEDAFNSTTKSGNTERALPLFDTFLMHSGSATANLKEGQVLRLSGEAYIQNNTSSWAVTE